MNILVAFIIGVVVGVIVYMIAAAVPFPAAYATLMAIVAFVLATYYSIHRPFLG